MADFNLTRRAWHRTMAVMYLAEGATEKGWDKRTIQRWAARHSYPTNEQNVKSKKLEHRVNDK
jgi:hypothetical protein